MNHDNPKTAAIPPAPPKLGRWVVVLVILTVVGVVSGLLPRLRARDALVQETRELAVLTVNVVQAKPGTPVSPLTLPAEVRPYIEAPIYARTSGYLKHWQVDIGASVTNGQLLAEIDTPELDRQLEGARADLIRAQADRDLAKVTADRWTELLKTASVSEQETAEKSADLTLKTANVDSVLANVHRLEEMKSFERIVAPFAGTLTARLVDNGDLINAGTGQALFRLADTRTLRVFVRVPQSASRQIAIGLNADLIIPELPSRKVTAKVVRTAGAIESDSRTLLTELEVDNARGDILSGSYAQVRFDDARVELPLVLPANTLIFRAAGTQVAVVGSDGKVELRKVTLGRDFGRDMEIVGGIATNEQVILNPSDSLDNGVTVRTAQAGSANAH